MLYEQVEKAERNHDGEIITTGGTCRFCKQSSIHKALAEWSQEELDELATETCECIDARIYVSKKEQKERANERIERLFGKENKSVTIHDAALDLLHKTVYPICEGFVQSVTIDIGNGIKAKICITQKGIVKVTRAKTDTSTYEA